MFSKDKSSQPNILDLALTGLAMYGGLKDFELCQKLIKVLDADPINPQSHQAFLEGIKKIRKPNPVDITSSAYNKALEILLDNPNDSNVINFVFEIGTWHYSAQDPQKVYTLNDLLIVRNILTDIDEINQLIYLLEEFSQTTANKDVARQVRNSDNLDEFDNLDILGDIDELVQLLEKPHQNKKTEQTISKSTIKKIENLSNKVFSFIHNPIEKRFNERINILLKGFVEKILKEETCELNDREFQEILILVLQKASDTNSSSIYNSVLNIYQSSSSQKALKLLVLEVGRWHFGKQRLWGRANQVDEQTIQNDILVRTKRN